MKLGLNFLPFALSCMPVDLMQESESSGDVPVDSAKIELPEISIGPLPHEMPGIIEYSLIYAYKFKHFKSAKRNHQKS